MLNIGLPRTSSEFLYISLSRLGQTSEQVNMNISIHLYEKKDKDGGHKSAAIAMGGPWPLLDVLT